MGRCLPHRVTLLQTQWNILNLSMCTHVVSERLDVHVLNRQIGDDFGTQKINSVLPKGSHILQYSSLAVRGQLLSDGSWEGPKCGTPQ